MRQWLTLLFSVLFFYATNSFAGNIDGPAPAKVSAGVHIVLPQGRPTTHQSYTKNRRFKATVYPGSLRTNINRIAKRFGWMQVVWRASYDYKWVGTTKLRAANLPDLLSQLIEDYPLQAVFYQGNHILVITPRTLR